MTKYYPKKRKTTRRTRKYTKKSYPKKRSYNTSTSMTVGRFIKPTMFIKLRYTTQFTLDVTPIGSPSFKIFRSNSIYDPEFTLGGNRPYGANQIEALGYQKYTVMYSKIKVTAINTNRSQLEPGFKTQSIVSISRKLSPTANLSSFSEILQQSGTNHIMTNNTYAKSVSQFYNPKSQFSIKDTKDNPLLRGLTSYPPSVTGGSNPTNSSYFIIENLPFTAGIDTDPVSCVAEITYYVMYSNRQSIQGS